MLSKPSFQPSNSHWTLNYYAETITRKQGREVLLNYPHPLRAGKLCRWKIKSLGLGVYELSLVNEK